MSAGRPRRHSSSTDEVDEDGNIVRWHGVKMGEFWKTDMQVAINDSNRRQDASFSIRMGKAGTTHPYQQVAHPDGLRQVPQDSVHGNPNAGGSDRANLDRGHAPLQPSGALRQRLAPILRRKPSPGRPPAAVHSQGRFLFRVQFFDHLCKRCTSYPPLPGAHPVAQTQRQTDPQPGSQPAVDGGQASCRHGREARTSVPAVPLMGTSPDSPISLNSDQDKVIPRQHGAEVPRPEGSLRHDHLRVPATFDPRNDSDESETEDEETEALARDNEYINLDSDDDDVRFPQSPATKSPLVTPERKVLTLNELLLRKKKPKYKQANPTHIQYSSSSSSDDELPDVELSKNAKKPFTRRKVTVKRQSPAAAGSHKVGDSSRSSPAMHLLQQQGCMRFSDLVLKCKRRDVSNWERRVVRGAAEQFASKLGNENFLVVMRDAQVYQDFHLTIPGRILEATGTERETKVEVCLLDREQAQYKAHWTREKFFDTPLLDRDAWAKFAVDHALEEGDVCVFQLLPQLPQLPKSKAAVSVATFLFFVHIFRVVETHDFSDAADVDS